MRYNNLDIWNKKERNIIREYNRAYEETDAFFENLYHHQGDFEGQSLIYREAQHDYALDVMEAIKDKSILLIQAGVGIGKSYGYLIPIFYTHKNVEKFKKVVISTSSIALQQQLLGDIDKISNMLGIRLEATIAKGISNYACLKKIESRIRSKYTPIEKRKQLEHLLKTMEELETCDKEMIKNFSEKIWRDVQLESRRYCSNCAYSKRCLLIKENERIQESEIVITNHANFIRNITDNELDTQEIYSLQDADMFVIDEAHQLETTMRNQQIQQIQLPNVIKLIDQAKYLTNIKFRDNSMISIDEYEMQEKENYIEELKHNIEKLFSAIRRSSSINFNKNKKENHSIMDCERLAFQYGPNIITQLSEVLKGMNFFIKEIENAESQTGIPNKTIEYLKLKSIYEIFKDMASLENSLNIYWVTFFKENLINLCYAPKEYYQATEKLLKKGLPVVYTSGTLLDNRGTYSYFKEGIGLRAIPGKKIFEGEEYISPFNYDENTLCYYDPNMPDPNSYLEYVEALAIKIDELIQITEGKALILFTSKKCMKDVYDILSLNHYNFNLYLHSEMNTNEVREAFTQEINSCLFATGAFFEGIDIKGKSLSNVIITHLPFDVVDAVTQYKADKYSKKKDQFNEVYIPSMLIKLEQAMGRLIRSSTDTGIISFLDSRFQKYLSLVKNNTQFSHYTTDIEEVIQFANQKILSDNIIQSEHIQKK